jgi:hypothetical protein
MPNKASSGRGCTAPVSCCCATRPQLGDYSSTTVQLPVAGRNEVYPLKLASPIPAQVATQRLDRGM